MICIKDCNNLKRDPQLGTLNIYIVSKCKIDYNHLLNPFREQKIHQQDSVIVRSLYCKKVTATTLILSELSVFSSLKIACCSRQKREV